MDPGFSTLTKLIIQVHVLRHAYVGSQFVRVSSLHHAGLRDQTHVNSFGNTRAFTC